MVIFQQVATGETNPTLPRVLDMKSLYKPIFCRRVNVVMPYCLGLNEKKTDTANSAAKPFISAKTASRRAIEFMRRRTAQQCGTTSIRMPGTTLNVASKYTLAANCSNVSCLSEAKISANVFSYHGSASVVVRGYST